MRIVRVSGNSMSPDYRDGDYLLVGRYRLKRPRPGDDIVFRHRDFGDVVKRIERIENDRIHVQGLNLLSSESAHLGSLPAGDLARLERVLYRISR